MKYICVYEKEGLSCTGKTVAAAFSNLMDNAGAVALNDCVFYELGEELKVELQAVVTPTLIGKAK